MILLPSTIQLFRVGPSFPASPPIQNHAVKGDKSKLCETVKNKTGQRIRILDLEIGSKRG